MLAHKADTEERHRGLSAASFATWPQLHPRAFISRSTDLPHVSWSSPPPVSGGGPAHGYSWNECRWHSVNMPNPPPPFFTSNEMGSIPVCSWSSASEFCSPKLCVLVLDYFQDVAYSFGHFPRLCSIRSMHCSWKWVSLFSFWYYFVFQMFFRAANIPLPFLILVSVFPSFVTLDTRYLNSMHYSQILTGSAVWQLFRIVLVVSLWIWSPTFAVFLASISVCLSMFM